MIKSANDPGSKSLTPAVDRAASILYLLETMPQKIFSLSDIARRLEIPKSTCLNICSALERTNLIRRSEGGFQLGQGLVQLGASYVASVDVVREFYAVCKSLAPDDLGALIQLAILDDDLSAVYLAREDCDCGLRLGLTAEIGRRVPANCTAAGKVLLGALAPADFEDRLAKIGHLEALTGSSIISIPELRKVVEEARKNGFARDDEETLPNLKCIAAPVKTTLHGHTTIAISISAAKHSLSDEKSERIRAVLDSLLAAMALRC